MILAHLALVVATLAGAQVTQTYKEWHAANPNDNCYNEFLGGTDESARNQTVLMAALRGRGHSVQQDGLFSIYLHEACYLHRVFSAQKAAAPGTRFLPTPKEIEASKAGVFGEDGVDVRVGEKMVKVKESRKPETVSVGGAQVLVFSRPPAAPVTGRSCEAAKTAARATSSSYDACYAACSDGCVGEDLYRCLTSAKCAGADSIDGL